MSLRALLPALALLGCSEYNLAGEEKPTPGGEETGTPPCTPPDPACTDSADPDTGEDTPIDTSPVDVDDCEAPTAEAGTVTILDDCIGTGSEPVADPYDLQIEYSYTSDGYGPVVKPSVTNLTDDNGDGMVDTNDIPDMVFTVYGSGSLVALSGDYSGEIFRLSGWQGAGDVVTADVNADGDTDICGFDAGGRVQCVDNTGALIWRSTVATYNGYPHITACDLDQDGKPEVIGDNQVINGEDGTLAFTLASSGGYSVPVCADLDQDGTAEILLGNGVFSHTGAREWSMGGGGYSTMSAVVNTDSDTKAEVFLATDRLYLYEDNGALINSAALPTQLPGPPCAADFDGDGAVEIAVPSSTAFYMYDTNGTLLWQAAMQDYSGLAGCSGYDMDGDGIYEVLFADEVAVRLYDGRTGTVLYESYAHNSGTLFEYPVVADVDLDGSAEIIVAENLGSRVGITVYGHGGDGWPAAGPTWASHDFAVTNIEADGSVPVTPDASWNKYNVFRARPAMDEPNLADLTGAIVGVCVADCIDGPVKVSLAVSNQGAVDIEAGVPWAFYKDDAGVRTLITTGTLPLVPAGVTLASFEIQVGSADVGSTGFVIGLNDSGSGVVTDGECDKTNNEIVYTEPACP